MDISKIIREAIRSEINKLSVSFPARIVAVSEDGNDVDVKPLILNKEGFGYRELPVIPSVPFLTPSMGSDIGIFFRPTVDQDVIILCTDTGFDHWIESGVESTESLSTRHSMNNAVAICGINAEPNRRSMISGSPLTIKYKNAEIDLNDYGEVVINKGSDFGVKFNELKTAYDELKLVINTHLHANPTSVAVPQVIGSINSAKVEKVRI